MTKPLVLCTQCGTKNRIGEGRGVPKCAKCGHVFDSYRKGSMPSFLKPLFKWSAIIGVIVGIGYLIEDDSPKLHKNPAAPVVKTVPAFNEPTVPISQGVVSRKGHGVAPLKVVTSVGKNYYLKLQDVNTRETILTAYIKGGMPFETNVPLGAYEIKYAVGDNWYGEQHLFGPQTAYSKADEVFHFTLNGNRYSGYTVELIMQVAGNLSTSRINRANF